MTKRRRGGPLTNYSPARATAARHRKRTPGKKQTAAHARAYAKLERRLSPRSPKPGTPAGRRTAEKLLGPVGSWSSEALHLRNGALAESLGRPGYEGSTSLWNEYLDDRYTPAYRAAVKAKAAQTRSSRKAGGGQPAGFVRVKAHRRRRPGRAK